MILKTLDLIANNLNDREITWGVGGSLLLYFHDLIDNYNDIDIIASEEDVELIINILDNLGHRTTVKPSKIFASKFFYKYNINGVNIDIIAGFKINHSAGSYEMAFDKPSIKLINFQNTHIPLCALEDWYIMYQLIPNKEEKVTILKNYFMEHGIANRQILESCKQNSLPTIIQKDISSLLHNLEY